MQRQEKKKFRVMEEKRRVKREGAKRPKGKKKGEPTKQLGTGSHTDPQKMDFT